MISIKRNDLSGSWTLDDQVGEFRGKHHLKAKSSDAYRESSRQVIKQNEEVIQYMRQDNRLKHLLLAQHENGDEAVIKNVFKNDRKERLSLQRYTMQEAIEEMDQGACEKAKMYTLYCYEREKREQRLRELSGELERMEALEKPSTEQKDAMQTVTQVENSLDKALIKYDTACIITQRYEEILDRLKDESLKLPAKLDCMEAALIQQRDELAELKHLSRESQLARDEAKKELSLVESEAYNARKQRDRELNAKRKEVEKRNSDQDKKDKKSQRAQLIQDHHDPKAIVEMQQKRDCLKKILNYEDAMQRIKSATHCIDIEDVVNKILTQQHFYSQLTARSAGLESGRNKLRDEGKRLLEQFHDLKYTGEQKMSRGQRQLEAMQEQVDAEEKLGDRYMRDLERNGDILIRLKTGVATLLNKLEDVKLRSPEHNYTGGDVFEQMDLTSKKVSQLMRDLHPTLADDDNEEGTQRPEFQEFMESRITEDNVRIKLASSEDNLTSEYDFDNNDNEDALTRNDIKVMGQALVDAKTNTKKRRGKKK